MDTDIQVDSTPVQVDNIPEGHMDTDIQVDNIAHLYKEQHT